MDERITRLTQGLTEMIQPYLGRQEYGDLRIVGKKKELPNIDEEDATTWFLNYEMIFGSSRGVSARFYKVENVFQYNQGDQKVITGNPEQVLGFFRAVLENIKPERQKNLRSDARLQKERGIPLEIAVAKMRQFADGDAKRFGPTAEELQLYEQFCNEVYSE